MEMLLIEAVAKINVTLSGKENTDWVTQMAFNASDSTQRKRDVTYAVRHETGTGIAAKGHSNT